MITTNEQWWEFYSHGKRSCHPWSDPFFIEGAKIDPSLFLMMMVNAIIQEPEDAEKVKDIWGQ